VLLRSASGAVINTHHPTFGNQTKQASQCMPRCFRTSLFSKTYRSEGAGGCAAAFSKW
jgi:hypothetical protein